MIHQND